MRRPSLFALILAIALPAAAQNPLARGSTLSPVDCASVGDMVVEYDPAPTDRTIAFVSSPIATLDARGEPVRFASYSTANPAMQRQRPFAEARHYVTRVSPANFRAALELLRSGPLPRISRDPADYRIPGFGFPGEVFPGTGDDDNVSFGASLTGLALREVPLARPRR